MIVEYGVTVRILGITAMKYWRLLVRNTEERGDDIVSWEFTTVEYWGLLILWMEDGESVIAHTA